MALHWELGHIANYKEVCFTEATTAQPEYGIAVGDVLLTPATRNLIELTMVVGIGRITEKNAGEFYARARLSDRLYAVRPEQCVTVEQVQQHIGLRTNVSDEARATWFKRIRNFMDRDVRTYEQRIKDAAAFKLPAAQVAVPESTATTTH
jgi:hypothetical protein